MAAQKIWRGAGRHEAIVRGKTEDQALGIVFTQIMRHNVKSVTAKIVGTGAGWFVVRYDVEVQS